MLVIIIIIINISSSTIARGESPQPRRFWYAASRAFRSRSAFRRFSKCSSWHTQ
jgi:hypothetical protein